MITDPLALTAVVVSATALAFWLDRSFTALSKVGASLLAILLGAALSNSGIVPVASPVYDQITGPITSLAVAWLLLSVKLSDVLKAGPTMLTAFALAVVGTAIGAFVAAFVFASAFGPETWKLAGTLAGTYSGGSLNYVSVGRAVGLPNDLFAGTAAADNLTTGLWLGATLLLPLWLGRWYPPSPGGAPRSEDDPPIPSARAAESPDAEPPGDSTFLVHPFDQRAELSTVDLAVLLATGVALLLAAELTAARIPAVPSILWLTTFALVVGHLPGLRRIRGSFQAGTLALHLFFVVIGIFSRVSEILAVGIEVFWLTLLVVFIHGVWTFGVGRLLRIDIGSLAVASQAAIGGPSSALAVAVAREWRPLVLPGIAVGLLGYAVGTYVGVAVADLVRVLGIGL